MVNAAQLVVDKMDYVATKHAKMLSVSLPPLANPRSNSSFNMGYVSGPLHMAPALKDQSGAYTPMDPLKAKSVHDARAFRHA